MINPRPPAGWRNVRLRFMLDFPRKSEIARLPESRLVSFVPMEAIGEYGGIRLDQTKEIDEVQNGYSYFSEGDVVVAKITPCFENGKGAIARGLLGGIGFGTTELHCLRARAGIDPEYLFYLTCTHQFRRMGEGFMYGAGGQKRVPESFIKDLVHPIPPLDQQQSIASFLDRETARIDELIGKKQRLVEVLMESRSTIISSAVTKGLDPVAPLGDRGVSWMGQVPNHWSLKPFRAVASVREGQVSPTETALMDTILIAPNHVEAGTGRIIKLETADEQAAISGKYRVQKGEIVYSKIRPALNKVCISPVDGLCSADMYAIRTAHAVDCEYLLYVFLSDEFVAMMVNESMRVAMPKVNRAALSRIRFALPPIAEQMQIVRFVRSEVNRIDALARVASDTMRVLREYRTALVSAAVTGQVDVRTYRKEPEAVLETA